MRDIKIILDVDDVVARFAKYYLEYLGLDLTPPTDWHDKRYIQYFDLIKTDYYFWLNIPAIVTQDDLDFVPYRFVTSRPIPSHYTVAWLEKQGFENPHVITVDSGKSKIPYLLDCDLFIDDAVHNYEDAIRHNIPVRLMDAPHNQQIITPHRIYDLKNLSL